MKKLVMIACMVMGMCLHAAEEEKERKVEMREEKVELEAKEREVKEKVDLNAIEQFLAAHPDIQQYVGGFVPHWKLQAHFVIFLGTPHSVVLSPNGTQLAVRTGNLSNAYIVSTASGAIVKEIPVPDGHQQSRCVFNAAGDRVAINGSDYVRIISLTGGADVVIEKNNATVIAFNPRDNTEILCASYDEPIEVYDANTGILKRSFAEGSQTGTFILSPDGNFLALKTFRSMPGRPWDIVDGIGIWNVASGIGEWQVDTPWNSLAYSYDGSTLLVINRKKKESTLFNATTGEKISTQKFVIPKGESYEVAWDVAPIFLDTQNKVMFMLAPTLRAERRVVTLDMGTGQVSDFKKLQNVTTFSANKERTVIAFGAADGTVFVWDVISGVLIQALPTKKNKIRELIFSDDGKRLVAKNAKEEIYVWRQGSYEDWLRERVARQEEASQLHEELFKQLSGLTRAEDYLPSKEYKSYIAYREALSAQKKLDKKDLNILMHIVDMYQRVERVLKSLVSLDPEKEQAVIQKIHEAIKKSIDAAKAIDEEAIKQDLMKEIAAPKKRKRPRSPENQ